MDAKTQFADLVITHKITTTAFEYFFAFGSKMFQRIVSESTWARVAKVCGVSAAPPPTVYLSSRTFLVLEVSSLFSAIKTQLKWFTQVEEIDCFCAVISACVLFL